MRIVPLNIEAVAPELRDVVRKLPDIAFDSPWRRKLAQLALAVLPPKGTPGVEIIQRRTASTAMRIYLPAERRSRGALLWIHGGGYIIGRAKQDDRTCGRTAARLGLPVFSAEYRLAPEHPFPVPLDDVHAAWSWLLEEAPAYGIDLARIAVGGESAGGGLAAALVQRLLDEGGVQPCAQWLLCPMLDDRTAANRKLDAIDNFVWNNNKNRFGWRSYLGAEPGAASLPDYAVPARRLDLSGLPPTWIGVGDIDLFWEEGRAYADRLGKSAVATEFVSVSGAPHGFEAWAADNPISLTFLDQAHDWLLKILGD